MKVSKKFDLFSEKSKGKVEKVVTTQTLYEEYIQRGGEKLTGVRGE